MRPVVTAVVTDLDNTLYDWVGMWGAAFGAMLEVLVEQSGVPQPTLEAEARAVHQRYGTTEYSFLVQALPSLRLRHPGADLRVVYGDAIHAYRAARDRALRLFPGVRTTLEALRSRGCLVVGYTDSRAFHCGFRVRRLGLDGLLDHLYSPPDHELPPSPRVEEVRTQAPEAYALERTLHRHTPPGEVKPNPRVLADILREVGADPSTTVYVGDSLMKDVLMAQDAGVPDVFARYGIAQHRDEYALLRRVSHWTDADIERERRLLERHVEPTYTLAEGFGQLLELFDPTPFSPRR